MRKAKLICVVCLIVLVAAVVVAGGLYLQASRAPTAYRPAQLSPDQKQQVVNDFARQYQDFYNLSQRVKPYTLTITQDDLNDYLGSIDEIASGLPGPIKAGEVDAVMQKAGLSDPAAALGDGVITLMVRSTDYRKVLSADLAFVFPTPETLQVKLVGTRVGRLSLSRAMTDRALAKLKDSITPPRGKGSNSAARGLSANDMAAVLTAVISAIDDEPVSTEVEIDRKRVRIVGIEITPEAMSIHLEPVGRKVPREGERHGPVEAEDWPKEFKRS